MKRLTTLILLGFFSSLIFAAQGGRPIKLESYDYHDYVNGEIQTKTFDRRDNGGYLTTATWSFERNPGEVVITKINTDGAGSIYSWTDDVIHLTDESYSWFMGHGYDLQTGTLMYTRYNIPGIVRMTNNMVPGIAWGTAGVIEGNFEFENHYTDKSELLGVEDVVVPAGTYTDCLKIHRVHDYGSLSARMDWVCPGIGLVKRVRKYYSIELTDVTFEE